MSGDENNIHDFAAKKSEKDLERKEKNLRDMRKRFQKALPLSAGKASKGGKKKPKKKR